MQALLLVGHGSRHSADSSAPVYAHAERIRRRRVFDEVRTAFWKEAPFLGCALDLVESDDVFVVPMFLAEGYYTREVVPRELGIQGSLRQVPAIRGRNVGLTQRGSQRVRYCLPVGAHPRMEELVLQRAIQAGPLSRTEQGRATLVVVGHGTPRSAMSGSTVWDVTAHLRKRSAFGAVDCGFLDQAPRIADVVDRVHRAGSGDTVLVPYFMAEGWHTRDTVPRSLGLTGRCTHRNGRTLWYAPAVGTLPEVAELVVDLAAQARTRTPHGA